MRIITRLLFAMLVTVFTMSIYSCKKTVDNWIDQKSATVYDTLTARSDHRIITYTVKNTGTYSVKGSVNDVQKTITVYLPYYYQLLYLEVDIELPQGATIAPSKDELVPVFSTAPFKYKITGKSGDTATYTIIPVVQQDRFWMNELSSTTRTISIDIQGSQPPVIVTGGNILPSYAVTTLHLIDKDGKNIYQFKEWTGSGTTNSTQMTFAINDADKVIIQAGTDYWLEMHSYALTYRLKYPVRFIK